MGKKSQGLQKPQKKPRIDGNLFSRLQMRDTVATSLDKKHSEKSAGEGTDTIGKLKSSKTLCRNLTITIRRHQLSPALSHTRTCWLIRKSRGPHPAEAGGLGAATTQARQAGSYTRPVHEAS
jgi:hypothetical protein